MREHSWLTKVGRGKVGSLTHPLGDALFSSGGGAAQSFAYPVLNPILWLTIPVRIIFSLCLWIHNSLHTRPSLLRKRACSAKHACAVLGRHLSSNLTREGTIQF